MRDARGQHPCWKNNSGWKTPPLHTDGFAGPGTEGTWHGIVISDHHGIEIQMELNNLTGTIPRELGNLKSVYFLSMDRNQLTGTIPTVLGNLSNLEKLNLGGNKLSGSIPRELGNLINLKDIEDDAYNADMRKQCDELEQKAAEALAMVEKQVKAKL